MAPCEGLQQIFENPPPENPSLLEALTSWKPLRSVKSIDRSYTELFGELHFREIPETSLPSALVSEAAASWSSQLANLGHAKNDDVTPFSSHSVMNSESLHLCTEGLGFESLDGADDMIHMKNEANDELGSVVSCIDKDVFSRGRSDDQYKTAKSCGSFCPPPLSSVLGRQGKSWVCFKAYRGDGRFVLEEVRIPTQEYLHASREDGRLKLCLVQPSDGEAEEDED